MYVRYMCTWIIYGEYRKIVPIFVFIDDNCVKNSVFGYRDEIKYDKTGLEVLQYKTVF